ncbi:hypothetical protein CYMTET_47326 [Cymbomonas tetramitiformis]|uniref:Helicase ATP-binding domain-containing protein n=1 Tax=Cymbomonas tetramitiformis TaxID=36881 RepID=A0AAE0BWI5_9CHLO|nr:hypothetical protein CYMTET_47326 [Cymbomonas tetramitiformis]
MASSSEGSRKRPRDTDGIAEQFTNIFKKPPRRVQREALAFLSERKRSDINLVEIDTGGGKSLVGVYHLLESVRRDAADTNKNGQGLYVCASIDLQKQLAMESKKWAPSSDIRVACLFGKDQYWCPARITDLLSDARERLPRPLELFLSKQRNINLREQNDLWLYEPPRNRFESFVQRERIFAVETRKSDIERVWSRISAYTSCKCYEALRERLREECEPRKLDDTMLAELNCPHGHARLLGKRASVLIINMSLAFTYLAHGLPLIKPNTHVVIDEAHLVVKKGDPLWKLPPDFNPEKVEERVNAWGDAARSVVASGVRRRDFLECCQQNQNHICFELHDKNKERNIVPTLRERVASSWKFANLEPYVQAQKKLKLLSKQVEFVERLFSDGANAGANLQTRLDKLRAYVEIDHKIHEKEIAREYSLQFDTLDPDSDPSVDESLEVDDDGSEHVVFEQIRALSSELLLSLRKNPKPSRADFRALGENLVASLIDVRLERMCVLTSEDVLGIRLLKRELNDWESRSRRQRLIALSDIANTITSTIRAMSLARQALSQDEWMNHHRLIVPNVSQKGIAYEASMSLQSRRLRDRLWKQLVGANGALVMSATLVDPSKALDQQFSVFETEVGLDDAAIRPRVRHFVGGSVFDRSLVTFRVPSTRCFFEYAKFRKDPIAREAYLQEQRDRIVEAVGIGRKSAIILCPNLAELNDLKALLREKTPDDVQHVNFNDSDDYKKFVSGKYRALIYGSDSLCTGIDLPGRIDLVVITRPWNEVWRPVQYGYEKRYMHRHIIEDMRMYVRMRHTTQAVGRLQRCPTDSGVVLFLGNNSDAGVLQKRKYASSAFTLS